MEYFSLIDVWRELNPSAKKYTWTALPYFFEYSVEGICFSNPERFYLFSIFQNPLFKFARRSLPWNNYGFPGHRITQVSDFYKSQGHLYCLNELNEVYNKVRLINVGHIIS